MKMLRQRAGRICVDCTVCGTVVGWSSKLKAPSVGANMTSRQQPVWQTACYWVIMTLNARSFYASRHNVCLLEARKKKMHCDRCVRYFFVSMAAPPYWHAASSFLAFQ